MNVMYRNRDDSADPSAPARRGPLPPQARKSAPIRTSRPSSRSSKNLTWVGFGSAAVVFVALSVFMLQNTGTAEFSFLWLDGSIPMAMVLLIATAAGFLLAQFRTLIGPRG